MQRTLNFTERKKIESKDAQFSIIENDGDAPEFDAVLNIDAVAFPEDASVYIEAYHKETRQRFPFGKVSRLTPPEDRTLTQIDLSGRTLFRVIVVDESGKHGLLLASGEGFSAESGEEQNRSSILAVVTRPLNQVPWKVDFETGGAPELCINNSIPNGIEKMRTDAVFQSLVLPAALRQVLVFYLWNDDDETESAERWMAFASLFADKPSSKDPSELMGWVDDVVAEFSSRFDLCDRITNQLRGET